MEVLQEITYTVLEHKWKQRAEKNRLELSGQLSPLVSFLNWLIIIDFHYWPLITQGYPPLIHNGLENDINLVTEQL